jgi:hypothetical protein
MTGALILAYLVLCGLIILFGPILGAQYTNDYYGAVNVVDNGKAILLCTVLAGVAGYYAHKQREHSQFLLQVFIAGLILRMLVAAAIFVFRGQEFFGGDALHYDFIGFAQQQAWLGDSFYSWRLEAFMRGGGGAAWGMHYMVAVIYTILGRNMLAVQFVNTVLGATTAVVIFQCAHHAFSNVRVARAAAIAVAFYPSLVLWSAQGLKDATIVFFLALAILATLKLGQKLSIKYVVVLLCSVVAVFSLRFYVFYMLCAAIGGAFVIGMQSFTATSFVRQFAAVILLGVTVTYIGVTRTASIQLERYGNLASVQRSRSDSATSAESGFGEDVDVSTTGGAISAIPVGLLYLLFAPFPWQLASLRQSITLPEMLVWWASFPLMILGLWFSIKHRLRQMSPVLIFTCLLTLAYSVVQGNVGTAYRQRAQLLVFYFIFVAVGFVLVKEKREEKDRQLAASRDLHQRLGPGGIQPKPQSGAMVEG